jgi:3-hydroxyisobutyrate dehydrogenase-like beta-hydroxyacid dehydrogenase
MTRVGFIGLGRMGSLMAANVVEAGFETAVWNRTRDKAEAFASRTGARVAPTPARLAAETDIVVSMVADGPVLEEIHTSPDGLLEGLAGATVVDMSTVGPLTIGRLAPLVAARGSELIDAPVSGSTAAAEAKTLMIMAGGSDAGFERVRPVLEAMGDPVMHVGGSGAGATLKLAINSMIFGINEAVSEALVLAERSGVDRGVAYEAFANSAAAAPVVKYRRPVFEAPGTTPVSFTVDLAIKDLTLILELAERTGVRMPGAEANRQVMQATSDEGHGDGDMGLTAVHLRGSM